MTNTSVYCINDIKLNKDELLLNETLFHNANGYIGVRSNFEEGYADKMPTIRGSYINGFYDITSMKQAEKLYGFPEEKQTFLNVADTQGITIYLNGERFNMFEGEVLESARSLNMDEGTTSRRVLWRSPKGSELEINIKRMTSFDILSLFTIEYCVRSINFTGEIIIESSHIGNVLNYSNPDDPRVAEHAPTYITVCKTEQASDGATYILSKTQKSGLSVCTGVKNVVSTDVETETVKSEASFIQRFKTKMNCGESITLIKYTVFSDSIRSSDCEQTCKEQLNNVVEMGLPAIYEKQKAYLCKYWQKAYLEIDGDDELSIAVRYNMYQLIQSAGKDNKCNVAAKGLSGEGYEGHYFWDTEMYIQPFFTLTDPNISKNLIEYRYSIIEYAREQAQIFGHKKGILYPWRTIMGKECSGYYPSGSSQYHINGDIAHSVVAYYLATKDLDFIAEKGAELVIETARLWMDVGNYIGGVFQIHEVTGPDEYTCLVSNNYYTNVCAKNNLYWASKFYTMLKENGKLECLQAKISVDDSEAEAFAEAAKNMLLPYDKELKINPQDDAFLAKPVWDIKNTPKDKFPLLLHFHPLMLYRHQVCKQADTVLAHFIFEDEQSVETIYNSFKYYEKITTHDSSLSTCIFSIVASKLGLEEDAYSYFGESAKLDLFNTHKNTSDGIHVANMGGSYMSIVYGFGGVRLKESGLHASPALPERWERLRFKINYEGSFILFDVCKDKCIVELESGCAKDIYVYGVQHKLEQRLEIIRSTK